MFIPSLILYLCITTRKMDYTIEIKPNRLLALIAAISLLIVSSGLLWLSTKGFMTRLGEKYYLHFVILICIVCIRNSETNKAIKRTFINSRWISAL